MVLKTPKIPRLLASQLKMIARQKDSGFGWKIRGFWISRRIDSRLAFAFLLKKIWKIEKKPKTYYMPMHMSFLKLNSTIVYFL
jgi:hypothetical protein